MQQKELLKLWANNDKRKEFLKNYKEWGLWLTVPELGLTYYKYELPDNKRILVMEYQCENPYPAHTNGEAMRTVSVNYLWDGDYFIPSSASDYILIDCLKNLKTAMQKELRANG